MLRELIDVVSGEVSSQRLFDHVLAICHFHRIQASPGYRRAAEYCVDTLLEVSPSARVIHYPADSGVRFWHYRSFEEWSAKRAILKIVSPPQFAEKVADFSDCPISVIQRSKATLAEGITTEVISAGEGRSEKDYRRARAKIALCDAPRASHVYDAASGAGVAGIILYKQRPLPGLRVGSGVYGARQYNSFWWDEKELFGFVLTPEKGEQLASYLRSPAAKENPIRAWALVEAESYPGTLEVVTSLIPGTEDKEIALVAHLCHPKPSAGDNASGVAALLEIHAVLSRLIEQGMLPQPRFGIRFLIVPEITGTFAYLSREHTLRHRLLMGINLDMVGQRQDVAGSTLCIESPPMAAPSFVQFVLEDFARVVFRLSTGSDQSSGLLSVRLAQTPFTGGSDHYVLSDPMVGAPTPMIIQWPDKYYHTSADTPDKLCPETLRSVTIAAAATVYACASGIEDWLASIADIAGGGLRKFAIDRMRDFSTSEASLWISLEYQAGALLEYGREAIAGIGRLLPRSKRLRTRVNAQTKAFVKCVKEEASCCLVRAGVSPSQRRHARESMREHAGLIVRRLMPGPVYPEGTLRKVSERRRSQYMRWQRREQRADLMQVLALYWADGERSVTDIARLVAAETGETNPDLLRFCFETLAEAGLVELGRR